MTGYFSQLVRTSGLRVAQASGFPTPAPGRIFNPESVKNGPLETEEIRESFGQPAAAPNPDADQSRAWERPAASVTTAAPQVAAAATPFSPDAPPLPSASPRAGVPAEATRHETAKAEPWTPVIRDTVYPGERLSAWESPPEVREVRAPETRVETSQPVQTGTPENPARNPEKAVEGKQKPAALRPDAWVRPGQPLPEVGSEPPFTDVRMSELILEREFPEQTEAKSPENQNEVAPAKKNASAPETRKAPEQEAMKYLNQVRTWVSESVIYPDEEDIFQAPSAPREETAWEEKKPGAKTAEAVQVPSAPVPTLHDQPAPVASEPWAISIGSVQLIVEGETVPVAPAPATPASTRTSPGKSPGTFMQWHRHYLR